MGKSEYVHDDSGTLLYALPAMWTSNDAMAKIAVRRGHPAARFPTLVSSFVLTHRSSHDICIERSVFIWVAAIAGFFFFFHMKCAWNVVKVCQTGQTCVRSSIGLAPLRGRGPSMQDLYLYTERVKSFLSTNRSPLWITFCSHIEPRRQGLCSHNDSSSFCGPPKARSTSHY